MLDNFTQDIIGEIASHLTILDICRCRLVNKHCYGLFLTIHSVHINNGETDLYRYLKIMLTTFPNITVINIDNYCQDPRLMSIIKMLKSYIGHRTVSIHINGNAISFHNKKKTAKYIDLVKIFSSEFQNRFEYITLADTTNGAQTFQIDEIYTAMINNGFLNPITKNQLPIENINYIVEHYRAYNLYKEGELMFDEKKILLAKYLELDDLQRRELSLDEKTRYYSQLHISDFADHFQNFTFENIDPRFERSQANNILLHSANGTWLLRHSSLNRIFMDRIKKCMTFYVLSYKESNNIYHILIIHQLGRGWTFGTCDVNEIVEEEDLNCSHPWYAWFLPLLDILLTKYNLKLKAHTSQYYQVPRNVV